ncbi:MAG TPA: hypothetical protein DEP17_04010, partial [Lachnospiraceae bacterium]|nr:hypothetical protein [Lachnospiraceae bacterium]
IDYGDSDLTPLIEGDNNNFRYDEGYEDAGFTKTNTEEVDTDVFDVYEEETEEQADDEPVDILSDDFYNENENDDEEE